MALQRTDKNHNINSCVCKISNSAQKRHEKLVKLWTRFILTRGRGKLRMNYGFKVHRIFDLVQSDLFGANVLCMLHTTIDK